MNLAIYFKPNKFKSLVIKEYKATEDKIIYLVLNDKDILIITNKSTGNESSKKCIDGII